MTTFVLCEKTRLSTNPSLVYIACPSAAEYGKVIVFTEITVSEAAAAVKSKSVNLTLVN